MFKINLSKFLVTFVFFYMFAVPVDATGDTPIMTDSELDLVTEEEIEHVKFVGQEIIVGYSASDDFIDNLENLGAEGYGYKIIAKLEEITSLNFKLLEVEGDVMEALRNGYVDVVGLFHKTDERDDEFIYLETPLRSEYTTLATKGYQGIFYDDPTSIDGKTVATHYDNPADAIFDEYLNENNISVEYLVGDRHNYLEQEADFYMVHSGDSNAALFHNVLNISRFQSYLISTEENKEVMDEINIAVQKIVAEEGDFFLELEEKYDKNVFHLTHRDLTREEVEILQQRPLSVGYTDNHKPFTYTDENGIPNGAVVDLMNKLASTYGFEVEYQAYDSKKPNFVEENFDILISVLGNTENTNIYFQPTESYYQLQMIGMVPLQIAESNQTIVDIATSSPEIGIAEYLYVDYDLFLAGTPTNRFTLYDTFEEVLMAYENDEVDMAIFTQSGTTYANAYFGSGENYEFVADFTLDFRFSISNDLAEEYIPIFNVMFDNITDREYQDILISHTTTYFPEKTFTDMLIDYWYYIFIVILLVGATFVINIYRHKMQKQLMVTEAYNTDSLTGLMSNEHFLEKGQEIINAISNETYDLISFDIDMFRTINSYYSSNRGTEVILSIGNALGMAYKDSETLYTRRTADQFLILKKSNQGETIETTYETYILPQLRKILGGSYNLSLSFGSVKISRVEDRLSEMIAHADYARNIAKEKHETNFVLFDDHMLKSFEAKLNITFRMEQAIKDREFKVFYQPKVNFKSLETGGAEALVRWFPSDDEIIYPDQFIEVFEENGFITTLDAYVFEEVCNFIKENMDRMQVPIISVNLSAISVLDNNTPAKLLDILDKYNLKSDCVELEITESAIISSENKFLSKVKLLKNMGFTISIDDFGAGVSSLNRLSAIEADILKLDKAFFDVKGDSKKSATVIKNIIHMAKELNMKIVTEGVETYEQAIWLQELKCDLAQGYFFSKPMPEADFKELLSSNKHFEIIQS